MIISTEKTAFDKRTNRFYISGKEVKFATNYNLVNPTSKGNMEFNFSHSTGSEWDPETFWVYKSVNEEYELYVKNDDVTPQHAQNYLDAKMRN